MTVYAGDHGGCMHCDSLGYELAEHGHRPGCSSPYAHEPPRPKLPPLERARKLWGEARHLRDQAGELESEAAELEASAVHVVRVNMTPLHEDTTTINVEGSPVKSHYDNSEAEDMAVCAALEVVAERIARQEIKAVDGFTVKVEFNHLPKNAEER